VRDAIAVLMLSLAVAPAASEGCGDKFQRVGRGARFQRGYVALHPACVLLYAQAGSAVATALRELEPALKHAGHKPFFVDTADGLAPALATGHYNLILTDVASVATVRSAARAVTVAPAILPVLHRPSPELKLQVEQEYRCFVQSPGKQADVLAEIDGLMERLTREGKAATQSPKK